MRVLCVCACVVSTSFARKISEMWLQRHASHPSMKTLFLGRKIHERLSWTLKKCCFPLFILFMYSFFTTSTVYNDRTVSLIRLRFIVSRFFHYYSFFLFYFIISFFFKWSTTLSDRFYNISYFFSIDQSRIRSIGHLLLMLR